MILETAKLTFNQYNTPESSSFGDLYFSNESGVRETDYVFISSNHLWIRWEQHKKARFNIAETGFGTGLNFFRTVQLFTAFKHQHPASLCNELYFCSTEKYPLHKLDLEKIFEQWKVSQIFDQPFEFNSYPHLQNFPTQLTSENRLQSPNTVLVDMKEVINSVLYIQQEFLRDYPLPIKGLHRRCFCVTQGITKFNVTLDLCYGDALESLSNIPMRLHNAQKIDAWFLDGFAPSKNEDMWQQALYDNMSRLSAKEATLATFTSAGKVKRGLAEAGFKITKQKGYGRKRDMLVGMLDTTAASKTKSYLTLLESYSKSVHHAPYFRRSSLLDNRIEQFNVVGSGLAGAILAYKLTSLGYKVNLIWQANKPADGASGNLIGGFYPQLNAQHNYASQIQVYSFLYAQHFYNQLSAESAFKHKWCGALQLGFNDKQQERLVNMQSKGLWPNELAQLIGAQRASSIANIDIPYDCLYLPSAGWISPPSLVNACLDMAKRTGLMTLSSDQKLLSFTSVEDKLECKFIHREKQKTIVLDNLILAMGHELAHRVSDVIPLRITRGQVELIQTASCIQNLDTLLCHKGYFTPEVDGFHALGSTYVKDDILIDVRQSETAQNFKTHLHSIEKANWRDDLERLQDQTNNVSRAAIRCSSSDHLPVVGALPSEQQFTELSDLYKAKSVEKYPEPSDVPNVFILTALGSRGLTTAPLMAEILVCQMLNKPLPLSAELLNVLNPNRFIVRSLIRQLAWQ